MLIDILVTLMFTVGLGAAVRQRARGGLIARHTYNNRYSDASAARDEHLG